MVIAVRQALDYNSTGRAVGVCFIGWIVQTALFGLFFWLAGGFGASQAPVNTELELRGKIKETSGRKVIVEVTLLAEQKVCAMGELLFIKLKDYPLSLNSNERCYIVVLTRPIILI